MGMPRKGKTIEFFDGQNQLTLSHLEGGGQISVPLGDFPK